jgi:hypothetical protein
MCPKVKTEQFERKNTSHGERCWETQLKDASEIGLTQTLWFMFTTIHKQQNEALQSFRS